MSRRLCTAIAATALTGLAGCGEVAPGSSRSLGAVSYEQAYAASRQALSQRFSVLPSDPASGVLRCRPKITGAKPGGLIGFTAATRRKLATLHLFREEGQVTARVSVAVQQQGRPVFRGMPQPADEYTSVPNRTPAEEAAAATPEQTDAWRTVRWDHRMEQTILKDIYDALHPKGAAPPATKPAKT